MDEKTALQIIEQNKKSYNAIAEDFDVTRQTAWPEFEMLAPYIIEGTRILDIGCGNGRLYKFLSTSYKLQATSYSGIDQSEELIKIAKKNNPPLTPPLIKGGNGGVDFQVADVFNLPFKDGEFDIVAGIAFLHHIPSKELRAKVLKEIYRVLAPGGILFLTNWNLFQIKLIKKYKLRLRDFFFLHNNLDAGDFWIPFHSSSHPASSLCHPVPSLCHPARSDSGDAGSRKKEGLDSRMRGNDSGALRYYHHFNKKELARLGKDAGFGAIKQLPGRNNIAILKK
ncbi:MAG: class I SAM-dependent methyltransferase [bacterium]